MDPFELNSTFVHLGLGARAVPLPDFDWSPQFMTAYRTQFSDDGIEGRLVCIVEQNETWGNWERHPAGEELVVLLSGRVDLVQEIGESEQRTIELRPGQATINPTNVWHTAVVHEPGSALFITPGEGTQSRPT
jgi:mannose-6-phosphate isomerase-like protein (cupin superfamily)